MKFERGTRRESLDASIARIAAAYGFTTPPVVVSKRSVADQGEIDHGTAVQVALIKSQEPAKKPTRVWGASKRASGSTLTFTILASRHAIAHALVVKAALAVAELSRYSDLIVAVSSIGDAESRRRFARELGTYFRKHASLLKHDVVKRAQHDPEGAYREVLAEGGDAAERLPRPIDYLSENSRKTMVDTLHLFEAVGIPYQLEPHLPATRDVHAELLFAVSGVDRKGERAIIATGGRLDELMKKQDKAQGHAVGISLELPEVVEPALDDEALLSCFVVHVGEAARLKAFALLDALWRADVSVQEALLAESLRDQMDLAKLQGARYIAIIGQREALDKTVILRNRESGTQVSLPVDKLPERLARK